MKPAFRLGALAMLAAAGACKRTASDAPPPDAPARAGPCRATRDAPLHLDTLLTEASCRTARGDDSHLRPSVPDSVAVSFAARDEPLRPFSPVPFDLTFENRGAEVESVVVTPADGDRFPAHAFSAYDASGRVQGGSSSIGMQAGGTHDLVRFELEPGARAHGQALWRQQLGAGEYRLELELPGRKQPVAARVTLQNR